MAEEPDEYLNQVYHELRKLAQHKMNQERAGQTLSATALVHEAYLRLHNDQPEKSRNFVDERHYFWAAAEAMRRILIDRARAKQRFKRGGDLERTELFESQIVAPVPENEILDIHEALNAFEKVDPETAKVVKLYYFVGLKWIEISEVMDTPERTLRRRWTYAKAWLKDWLESNR